LLNQPSERADSQSSGYNSSSFANKKYDLELEKENKIKAEEQSSIESSLSPQELLAVKIQTIL
jgi:hypothetical protein